jgi:hypothetical protein
VQPEEVNVLTSSVEGAMRIQHHVPLGLLLGGLLSVIPSPVSAQTTATGVGLPYVWIHKHTGIIQEPINTAEMYEGVNKIAVALGMDGARKTKVYRMEAVENMERGMPVVVHSEVSDDQTMSAAGRLTSVDRVHGKIGVKYDDGRTETLRVSQHSTAGTLNAEGRRVIVYSSNKSGQQVVQYFKRKS